MPPTRPARSGFRAADRRPRAARRFGPRELAKRVVDFSHGEGDRLIVHGIDANVGSSSNEFVFIDTEAFSGAAGELRYETDGGFTLVQGDVDGDGSADFEIELTGNIALRAGDFGL